jgi:flagellar assembly protein FliH
MGASDRFSRTIPKDEVGEAAQWELRPLSGGKRVPGATQLSARRSDTDKAKDAFEAGREEGRAQGYADVMRSAQQARAADLQRLETLLGGLRAEFDALTAGTADTLLDLAIDVASQVLCQELQLRREAILPVVREALAVVAGAHGHPTVHLAPVDYEWVRVAVQDDGTLRGCRFVADPGVAPGGCRVESPSGEIDATLPTRWKRVLQSLGAEAPAPRPGPGPSGTEPQ